MKRIWLYAICMIVTIICAACSAQPVESPSETAIITSPPAAAQSGDEDTLLLWEGPALFAENPTECHRLRVTPDNHVFIGLCNGEQAEVEFVDNRQGGLADLIGRFAPFQADTPQGLITFNGQGQIAGLAWERAITTWASFTYAELASGRMGAANRTALAWHLGQESGQSNQCRMLLVLAHGYATAGLTPCAGGQMQVLAGDWVDTAEWEQFDAWLYNKAPFYQNDSYLDGRGATELSNAEAAALGEWAETVYAKLSQTAGLTPTITPPALCLTPAANQQLLLDEANKYCLLYPADYSLVQSTTNTAELVNGDIMNHIDPRLSIAVEDAAGRTLADAAAQLEADYAPPGFMIEPKNISVAGVEAVMLDNLPGQDLNRRVAFIQDGRLYSLFLAPIGDQGSETRHQAELLYQQAIDTFRFLTNTGNSESPSSH